MHINLRINSQCKNHKKCIQERKVDSNKIAQKHKKNESEVKRVFKLKKKSIRNAKTVIGLARKNQYYLGAY